MLCSSGPPRTRFANILVIFFNYFFTSFTVEILDTKKTPVSHLCSLYGRFTRGEQIHLVKFTRGTHVDDVVEDVFTDGDLCFTFLEKLEHCCDLCFTFQGMQTPCHIYYVSPTEFANHV